MSRNGRATAVGIVQGKVQGVWFRAFTREQALKYDLSGYARNQADGSVAFALCGQRRNIEKVLQQLHLGPPLSRVDKIEYDWLDQDYSTGFETG